jgi:hypothetical protein
MRKYDPDRTPDSAQWLALDEQLRIGLVESYHRAAQIELPNVTAHAAFHAIVENQIAEQHLPVIRAMKRLAKQGLSRHDSIHAIAWILAGCFHEVMTSNTSATPPNVSARYDAAIERLDAATWLSQAGE